MAVDTATLPTPGAQILDKSQLKKLAYSAIEERIVLLEFKPGQVLSEVSVSRELGIGRTPVREALQRLAIEGLVDILPSRGIIVAPMDLTQHIRLLETRRCLEILAAELASQRTNPSEREEFRTLAAEFRKAGEANDERAFLDADHRFNALLLAAAKNDYMTKCMHLMSGLSRRHFYYYRKLIDIGEVALLHAEIADAILIGNNEDTRCSVNKLMDFNEAFTRRAIDTPWAAENPKD